MSRPQNCGFVSLLYSVGEKPLNLWSKHVSLDGRIRRVEDEMLRGDKVIEIMGPLQSPVPTNITCPANPKDVLNIKLPILVFVIKNLELIFKVEFQLLDKQMYRRQFSLTTHNIEKRPQLAYANAAQVPLKLDEGWNSLEINLQTLCNEVYGTDYQAIQRIIVFPNCRLRRVYFQDKHYRHDETPVELCQAFFDMYMLKWGIHLVERSCQTEERFTGPLQPYELEYFATDSNMSVSVTTTSLPLYEDYRMNQVRKIMRKDVGLAMALGKNNTVVLRSNSEPANQLCKKSKTTSNYEFKISNGKRSPDVNNFDGELTLAISNRKIKSANLCKKDRNGAERWAIKIKNNETRFKDKSANCGNESKSLSLKEKKVSARLFPQIEKSQYLRKEMGENFLNLNLERNDKNSVDKTRSNYIVESKIRSKASGQLDMKVSAGVINSSKNIIPSESKSASNSEKKCLQNSKAEIDTSVKKLKPDVNGLTTLKKLEIHQGDGLLSHSVRAIEEVINEVQRIREQLNDYGADKKVCSKEKTEALENSSYDVPPVVEKQAAASNDESKKTVLATDTAVCDFLELRHAVNKKILEKLRDKGLTITEVELSIYNSKNRRNCYGQGKIIESWKGSNDKGSGLSSVEPLKTDISLKKERLSLNDKICMQLRSELDAALLKLKSTQVRATSEVVDNTTESIAKDDTNSLKSGFFSTQEAEYIKKKVGIKNVVKSVKETLSHTKNGEYPVNDFIKNLDKYSGTEIVNILFQRQTHDSETEPK